MLARILHHFNACKRRSYSIQLEWFVKIHEFISSSSPAPADCQALLQQNHIHENIFHYPFYFVVQFPFQFLALVVVVMMCDSTTFLLWLLYGIRMTASCILHMLHRCRSRNTSKFLRYSHSSREPTSNNIERNRPDD